MFLAKDIHSISYYNAEKWTRTDTFKEVGMVLNEIVPEAPYIRNPNLGKLDKIRVRQQRYEEEEATIERQKVCLFSGYRKKLRLT